MACYATDEDRMYVPGESTHGVPVEYALTHEYGHHLASWRSNNPWDALDWGAKHWASEMRVCAHVARGRLFPGNQGAHYLRDPGEGFADGYAHLHYPERALAVRLDLASRPRRVRGDPPRRARPWTGPRSRTLRGRLGQGRGPRAYIVPMTLDGDVSVRFDAARGVKAEVELESGSFASGETLPAGEGFGIEWCRAGRDRAGARDGPPPRGQRAVRGAHDLPRLSARSIRSKLVAAAVDPLLTGRTVIR